MQASDPATRREALERAGGLRVPDPAERAELEEAVAEAVLDGDPGVRVAAVRALARLGARDSLRTLVRASREDPAPRVRREAVAALARLATSPRSGPA